MKNQQVRIAKIAITKKMKIVTGRLECNRKALTNKRFKYAAGL